MAKVRIGKIEEELIEKTKVYKKLTGTSTVGLIEELLTDFFKDSLLTNDFLELEEPFYFINNPYFYEDEIIKAALDSPIGAVIEGVKIEPEEVYIVNKVPNNLDSFSKEHNKFCFSNNPNRHKGIYIHHKFLTLSDRPEECIIEDTIYLFDYNEADKTLIIDKPSEKELEFKIDLATHKKVYDSILDELYNYKNWIYETNVDEETSERIYKELDSDVFLNYIHVFRSDEVIESYEDKIAMKNFLVRKGLYNPEDELAGVKKAFFKDRKLVKPTDLEEVFKNE